MRVLLMPGGLPLDYTIQLANALSKNNKIIVKLIIYNLPTLDKKILENLSVDVELYITGKFKYPIFNPKNFVNVYKVIKEIYYFNPDIIHVQPLTYIDLLILSFIYKYPLIATIHDPKLHLGEETLFSRFAAYYLRMRSSRIFVHGKILKEIMVKEYNLPDNKVCAIPMGEHNSSMFMKYLRKEIKCENHTILFFGRIGRYKGLEYLIQAEPIISKNIPDLKIIVAGKPVGKVNMEKFKKMMNKGNYLVYDSFIDWELGAELFQKASVIVLPYIEATQSGVIPVAYAFKKPVVVTRVGALPEIVDDGKTGLIVPPKDPEALADAIIKLLKDEKLRKEMGEAGYKKLKTDMSWDKISEIIIEAYKEVLNDKNQLMRN